MLSMCDMTLCELFLPGVSLLSRGHTVDMRTRESYGLCFCLEGQITYRQGDREVICKPSTVVLLPKGGGYSLHVDRDGRFPLVNFLCEGFSSSSIASLTLCGSAPVPPEVEELSRLFLLGESRAARFACFYRLIDRITTEGRRQSSLLLPVIRYMEEHLCEVDLDNVRLARELGVSEVYFRRLFGEAMGLSPRQYLLRLRMEKAKQLLCQTHLCVTQIAALTGFSSVYHFSRTFRERTGQSPSEYAGLNRRLEL